MYSAFYISNSSKAKQTYGDRTSGFRFPAQSGPDFISAIGNLNIPPGFTSVNPPAKSRIYVKKKHGSYENNNQPLDIVAGYTSPMEGSSDQVASGACRRESPAEAASAVPCPDQMTPAEVEYALEEEYEESAPAPSLLADAQIAMVNVGRETEQAKRPRGRPPGAKTKKRKRAESEHDEISDLGSGSTGGKAKLSRINVCRRLSLNSSC